MTDLHARIASELATNRRLTVEMRENLEKAHLAGQVVLFRAKRRTLVDRLAVLGIGLGLGFVLAALGLRWAYRDAIEAHEENSRFRLESALHHQQLQRLFRGETPMQQIARLRAQRAAR